MTHQQRNERGSEAIVSFQTFDEPEGDIPLSLEEQRLLAGAAPLVAPEERLDLEPPTRGWANAAVPRTVFVTGLMGIFCFLAFSTTLLFGGRRKVAETPAPEPEPTTVAPDQNDQLKTQLALVGQGQAQNPSPSRDRTARPPVPQKAKPQPTTKIRPTQPQSTTARSPSIRVSTPTKAEGKTPEPKVDPFEQWNALANAGTMRGDIAIEPNSQASIDQLAEPIAEVRIASATLGAGSLPNMTGDRPPPIAPPELMESGIELSPLSPGATGILQHRSPVSTKETTQAEIPLGTVAEAKVMVPLIWSGSSNTRSAVELKDALKDAEGKEVLPPGTIFITEITNVDEDSRLIEQTAIAILYEKDGQQVQENIPPGLILILDKDLEPLKADRVRSRSGFNVGRGIGQVLDLAGNELDGSDISSSAASGLLGELADQVRQRNNRGDRLSYQTALTIKAGKTVSVMVNGFLGVSP
jgi:hypothetical protein